MAVATECLNRGARTQGSDGLVDYPKRRAACSRSDRIMTDYQEQIDGLRILNGIQEPTFLDKICRLDDLTDVRISLEIVKNAKGHDAQAVCSRKVAEFISDVLELPSFVVPYLNVACDISLAVYFAELIERFIRNVGNVELMVTCSISLHVMCRETDLADRLSEDRSQYFQKSDCLMRHLV